MTLSDEAFIIHDGRTIIEASPAFIELFRVNGYGVVDRKVEDIIATPDFRALAKWRGENIIRDGKYDVDYRQHYAFLRFDGTRFWGESISRRIAEHRYKTIIVWEHD